MAGYRGGYAPFHEAVAELAARGVFDPGEVTDYVSNGTSTRFKNDEMQRPFEDGVFQGVSFQRKGLAQVIISFDMEDGSDVLFVETFDLASNYSNSLLWDSGTGEMEVLQGGSKIEIRTVCHKGDEASSDFSKPRRTFSIIRRGGSGFKHFTIKR